MLQQAFSVNASFIHYLFILLFILYTWLQTLFLFIYSTWELLSIINSKQNIKGIILLNPKSYLFGYSINNSLHSLRYWSKVNGPQQLLEGLLALTGTNRPCCGGDHEWVNPEAAERQSNPEGQGGTAQRCCLFLGQRKCRKILFYFEDLSVKCKSLTDSGQNLSVNLPTVSKWGEILK